MVSLLQCFCLMILSDMTIQVDAIYWYCFCLASGILCILQLLFPSFIQYAEDTCKEHPLWKLAIHEEWKKHTQTSNSFQMI